MSTPTSEFNPRSITGFVGQLRAKRQDIPDACWTLIVQSSFERMTDLRKEVQQNLEQKQQSTRSRRNDRDRDADLYVHVPSLAEAVQHQVREYDAGT